MEDSGKHIINKIAATINCSRQDWTQVQHLGLASCIEKSVESILPLLDRKFQKKLVRLDNLSIEVNIKNKSLPDLSRLISGALTDALKDIEDKKASQKLKDFQEVNNLSPHEVFFHFLRHGEMPWFAVKLEWEKLDFANRSFISEFLDLLKSSPIHRERLVSQFSAGQLKQVLVLIWPSKTVTELFQFRTLVTENTRNYSVRFASGFRLQQLLLGAALQYMLSNGEHSDFYDFLNQYWPSFAIAAEKECNGKHHDFLNFLLKASAPYFKFEIPVKKTPGAQLLLKEGNIGRAFDSGTLDKKEALKNMWKEETSDYALNVNHAGIILLHPFLSRFFVKVGLLENNRFISPEHQQRGICLLHNMATGELVFPEEKLVLCKYLCNYPQKLPVPRELPISNFELQEIDTVLHSAIEHWTALKRTSKDGLRVNFLQRKGLIEEDSIGQTIHVENHAADILLDQLPWGLSTVHFPWLPDLLTIKWR